MIILDLSAIEAMGCMWSPLYQQISLIYQIESHVVAVLGIDYDAHAISHDADQMTVCKMS